MSLPVPGFQFTRGDTALLVIDPQNDFLSPAGVTWGVVGQSVTENQTVDHIERLFRAAKNASLPVFVSPHYYYPNDHMLAGETLDTAEAVRRIAAIE